MNWFQCDRDVRRERVSTTYQAFIQALFSTAVFPKDLVSLLFAESVGHQGKIFLDLGLQIAGKCISDTPFAFKAHIVHRW